MPLVDDIAAALTPLADPARAAPMRAYMGDQFAFLGIGTPARRAASRPVLRASAALGTDTLLAAAGALWALPEREFQYAAIDLLARSAKRLGPDDIDPLLALARHKSWWDTVDALSGIIGDIVRAHRECQPRMDACAADPDKWVRRIAMLHQNGWRGDTDTRRLFGYARQLAHEPDFFIRKAIGWALRDHAHHDPDAVRAFLQAEGGRLSTLTRREAAKHL